MSPSASPTSRVSLSKSALLLSGCIAWAGPQVEWYDESKVDPADKVKQTKGIQFHDEIDFYTKNGVAFDAGGFGVDAEVFVWLQHAVKYLTSDLLPRCQQVWTEAAIAVHWESGKVQLLPDVKNREYPNLGKGWQYGTADFVAILADGSLLVADWKTGGTDGAEEQLLSLAAGFRKALLYENEDSGPWRKVRISCLQVNEHGVWPHEREVSDDEIDAHWDAMTFAWEDVGKKYAPNPGIHCVTLYCPHLAYCTAVSNDVREAALMEPPPNSRANGPIPTEALLRKVRLTDNPSNDTEAGEVMAAVSAAKRQLNYLIEGAKKYIESGGKVVNGHYEWSDGANGFRWRKR